MATFYHCSICGNMLETINDSGVTPVCCGQPMTKLVPASVDAATEKHVPVCKQDGNKFVVTVGEVTHPMEEAHYIQWIAVCTDAGYYRKDLKPGEAPTATFCLGEGEKVQKVYEYCNLHGLWEAN